MRKSPLLLPIVVMLLSGCSGGEVGGGEAFVNQTFRGGCIGKWREIAAYANDNSKAEREGYSNAFSAWCWVEDCLQMMNQTIGGNVELAVKFSQLRIFCGDCRLAITPPAGLSQGLIDELNSYCEQHQQKRNPPPGQPQD